MPTPFTPDQAAAHQFLTQLRTRISTQPLPYQQGTAERALQSLWEVFGQAREAMERNPGCEAFAGRTTDTLNLVLRPLTAKWHRAFEEGRLSGRDGADEFRGELEQVQERLREFASELHEMAYGSSHVDALAPDVMDVAELDHLFRPIAFGFVPHLPALATPAAQIARDEGAAVATRRDILSITTAAGTDAIGLALSGGGIRSATFSLGVVQVLAEKGFLKEVDFLSTVSGGGYTGSFLTQALGYGDDQRSVAAPHGPDTPAVRRVRQHAKFLLLGNLKEQLSMVTATLAGMLLNWTAPLLVILLAALAVHQVAIHVSIDWSLVLRAALVSCGMAVAGYGWGIRRGQRTSQVTGGVLGWLLALTALAGLAWGLERSFPGLVSPPAWDWPKAGSLGAALAALAAAVPSMTRFLPVLKQPKLRRAVLRLALMLAGILLPLLALLLFYAFRALAVDHLPALLGLAAALAVIALLVLDINLTGPHRLYRDGLSRTFIQRTEDGSTQVRLDAINPQGTAPYHLVNAAVNLPTSADPALKDRRSDFFVFSKHWTGSPAVGYYPTSDWQASGKPLELGTAMAVSGAAVSAHMGLASIPTLAAMLTFLNVRLGIWVPRPDMKGTSAPGFACLLREMTGVSMSERQRWLNLSDGGHIENLGLYELLRRRCKLIVCVDGEADPGFTFAGLMTVVRHAQIDFGVRLDPRLDDLRADPKTGCSTSHFHLCRIHYPEAGAIGLLLYIKLSVTGNESELIRRYRRHNPDFPHQSTADQFFDQEQFEAYRQLGVHAAESLFLPALMNGSQPASLPEAFRKLAKNLLEPLRAAKP